MRNEWLIDTHGKPLQTVQKFLYDAWHHLEIQAMILPLKDKATNTWKTEVIDSPDSLSHANPFTPLMPENIALKVPEFVKAHDGKLVAALLRPCETRAVLTLKDKTEQSLENLLMFSTDCLGTFPATEFSWRAKRKGPTEGLAEETLQFSRQGGIVPYRYRTACQLCTQQTAGQADLNIHIVGLPVRQKILISTSEAISRKISPELPGIENFDRDLIDQHLAVSEKMLHRNLQTHSRLSQAMVADTNLDLENLVEQLNSCGNCQACMEVCPICAGLNIKRDQDGFLSRQVVADWMISCVGCGICEENCSLHRPLSAIFSVVKEQLDKLGETG